VDGFEEIKLKHSERILQDYGTCFYETGMEWGNFLKFNLEHRTSVRNKSWK
jgi:hypothetical protein